MSGHFRGAVDPLKLLKIVEIDIFAKQQISECSLDSYPLDAGKFIYSKPASQHLTSA